MTIDLPERIRDDEMLGRSVFSGSAAERGKRKGVIIRNVFQVRPDEDCISVDRMNYESDERMALLADVRGKGRGATFYGWAMLSADDAAQAGDAELRRTVEASPLPENPYHANVVMTIPADLAKNERQDIQKQHAVALAACAKWRPRPDATAEQPDRTMEV